MARRQTDRERRIERMLTEFNDRQKHAFKLIQEGKNVCITGPGGAGKSWFINKILEVLDRKTTFVTAMTDIAASPLRGSTLHKFAKIGLGEGDAHSLVKKIRTADRGPWRAARKLLIDEVSMLSADLLDKVEHVARLVQEQRTGRHKKPFGGVQVIFVGDFMQLPPVPKPGETTARFAFESKAWTEILKVETVEFTEIKRQQGDVPYMLMLNEMRFGYVGPDTIKALRTRTRTNPRVPLKLDIPPKIIPTQLYARRFEVYEENIKELVKLPGKSVKWDAQDEAPGYTQQDERFKYLRILADKQLREAAVVKLRIDAQVMLTRNGIFPGLSNGSRGVVTGFVSVAKQKKPKKELTDDEALQLMLADDTTRDSYEDETKMEKVEMETLPLVQFCDGKPPVVVHRVKCEVVENERVVFERFQLPLALAWAVTIHKCQGMTLDAARVSMESMFEYGHAYVALSRVKSLAGLELIDFNASKVKANPRALAFYRKLAGGALPTDVKSKQSGIGQYFGGGRPEEETKEAKKKPLFSVDAKPWKNNSSSSAVAAPTPTTPTKVGQKRKRDEHDEQTVDSEATPEEEEMTTMKIGNLIVACKRQRA